MSSYFHKGTDLDAIFEPLLDGDPKVPEPVGLKDANIDARDKFVPLFMGARYSENVGFAHKGVDLRDLFAMKGSVVRFLDPLPWDTQVTLESKFYQQPSRPLITPIYIYVEIKANGQVKIASSKSNQHSNPAVRLDEVLYDFSSPPVWDDTKTPVGVDYEIKFDIIGNTGTPPISDLTFGVWHRMDGTPASGRVTNIFNYTHNSDSAGLIAKGCFVQISVRRSDYPDNLKTDGTINMVISLNVLASLFTSAAPYLTDMAAIVTTNVPQNPEGKTADYSVNTIYEVKGSGNITIKRNVIDITGSGLYNEILNVPWRRGLTADDTTVDDFEVKFISGLGVTYNGATDWEPINANSDYVLTMSHVIANNLAVGDHTQASTATLLIRQKSTKGYVETDNFTGGNIKATTTIRLGVPSIPDWSGMTLPNLTNHRTVDINYAKPARWETAGVRYIMGYSDSTSGKNVIGRKSSQTTDNVQNPTEPIITEDVVLSRITPDGWKPSWFEWRYRVLNGAVDGPDANVWRTMIDASYVVQVSSSINHGSGAGEYSDFAVIAIDVRRISAPTQTYTFGVRLESSVTLIANGPPWDDSIIPNLLCSVPVSVGRTYQGFGAEDVAIAGYIYQAHDDPDGTLDHFGTTLVKVSDLEVGTFNSVIGRLVPAGWNAADFEWKYDVVSIEGLGAFINGYYRPGEGLLPSVWADMASDKIVQFFLGNGVPQTVGTVLQSIAIIKVTVRNKATPSMTHTFPPVALTSRLTYQAATNTLWPREDFENWAGTYYHTSQYELPPSGGGNLDFEGTGVGQVTTYVLSFRPNGKYDWIGNGTTSSSYGDWTTDSGIDGSNFSIRYSDAGGVGYSGNINTNWQTINLPRTISLAASRPPAGEPDNTAVHISTVEIRNNTTGAIVFSKRVVLNLYVLRG